MQVSSGKGERQHSGNGLFRAEFQLPQKTETDQRRQHADKNVHAVADKYVAYGRIILVVGKSRKSFDVRAHYIERKQQKRLSDAVPTLQLAVAAIDAEFRVFLRRHRRHTSPPRVAGFQPMERIGRAKLAGLHHECTQTYGEAEQEEWITEPAAESLHHDGGNKSGNVL